jgi:hypothetical protein
MEGPWSSAGSELAWKSMSLIGAVVAGEQDCEWPAMAEQTTSMWWCGFVREMAQPLRR